MAIYLVLYTPNTHDSSPEAISAHQSMQGAYKALRAIILHRWQEFRNSEIWWRHHDPERERRPKFGAREWWGIQRMELQP